MTIAEKMLKTLHAHHLAMHDSPVLLMVSGGSDSTAMAYLAAQLRDEGQLGPLAMLHVNHQLRGADADRDAEFVARLAELLETPLFMCTVDVGALARAQHGNVEAIARHERYQAALDALESHCLHVGAPADEGRIFVAHTADDRIENFYMRSIVGTGPGGFRSMTYRTGQVVRPLLEVQRDELRAYLRERAAAGLPTVYDEAGALWRDDATNEETDRFRTFVRHKLVPLAKERNPQLADTLTRTMNLIADEDDMLEDMASELVEEHVTWLEDGTGCVLSPWMAAERVPLARRVVVQVLGKLLGPDARVETASVEAVLAGFEDGRPNSGYVTNIQGNLAVSANRNGVRIEPMAAFRARRKKD